MADDPTVQFPLRRTRDCPTCGHHMLLEDERCGLCGSTLPPNAPPTQVKNELSAPLLPVDSSDPTLVTSSLPRPTPVQEETAKAPPPSSPQPSRVQKETTKTVSSLPPPPQPTRVQKEAVKAVPLPPPPSSSTFGVTLTDSPIESSPVRQPTLPPMAPVQPPWFAKWGKLSAGALALFLISFFAAKLFLSSQGEKVAESPPPKATAERLGEQSSLSDKREKEAVPASVTPTPLVPPLVGRVTTAEELLPIRIFGAAPNDELRGVNAFRVQVEAWVPEIREVYNVQLAENPQALGAAILELRVVPEGQVVSAAVHVTGSISRSLQQTILDAVKTLRFVPVQGEEVKVFYPLLFSPEKVDPVTFVSHVKEVWPGRYKVLSATAVPVHAEASDDAQEVGTIGPGLFVSVVSSRDGWLGALSPKGKVGYVRQETIFPRIENTTDTDVKG